MNMAPFLLLAGLIGCAKELPVKDGASPADDTAGIQEVPDPGEPGGDIDDDGDGWFRRPSSVPVGSPDWDCWDASPEAHPGATEKCDTIDNDCNGIIDDVVGGCSP